MPLCECHTKHGLNFHWSFGNSKLKKNLIIAFNIPALKDKYGRVTCPNAQECAVECYALGNRYVIPNVLQAAQHNVDFLFEDKINKFRLFEKYLQEDIALLQEIGYTTIRIHTSGDFFSFHYYLVWLRAAKKFPQMKFYAYTKMVKWINNTRWFIPENMKITCSFGGKQDNSINKAFSHAIVFSSLDDLNRMDYIDTSVKDTPARDGEIKIGLLRHGNRVSKKKRENWKSTEKILQEIE